MITLICLLNILDANDGDSEPKEAKREEPPAQRTSDGKASSDASSRSDGAFGNGSGDGGDGNDDDPPEERSSKKRSAHEMDVGRGSEAAKSMERLLAWLKTQNSKPPHSPNLT